MNDNTEMDAKNVIKLGDIKAEGSSKLKLELLTNKNNKNNSENTYYDSEGKKEVSKEVSKKLDGQDSNEQIPVQFQAPVSQIIFDKIGAKVANTERIPEGCPLDNLREWYEDIAPEIKCLENSLKALEFTLFSKIQDTLLQCNNLIKAQNKSLPSVVVTTLQSKVTDSFNELKNIFISEKSKDTTTGSKLDSTSNNVKNGDGVVPKERLSEDEEEDIDVLKENVDKPIALCEGETSKTAKQDSLKVIEKKEDEHGATSDDNAGAPMSKMSSMGSGDNEGVQGFGSFAGFEWNKEKGPSDFFEKLEKFGENESIYVEAGACESVNNTSDSKVTKLSSGDYAKLCEIAVESYVEGRCKDLKCTGDGMELDGERQLYMQEANVYLGENYCFQPVRVQHVLLLSFLNDTNLIKNGACINSIASHLKLKNIEFDKFLKSSSYDLIYNEMNGTNGTTMNSIDSLTQPGSTFGAFTGFETNLASNGNLDDFFDKVGAKDAPNFGQTEEVRNGKVAQQTQQSVGTSGKNGKRGKNDKNDKNDDGVLRKLEKELNKECGDYKKTFGHKRNKRSEEKFASQAALEALTGVTQDGNENESEEPNEGHMSDAEGNGPNVTPRSPLSKKSKRSVKNE